MVPLYSILYPLSFLREAVTPAVFKKRLRQRFDDRQTVFMDLISVLFCCIRQINCRRRPTGDQRNAPIHGSHVYRSDSARAFGFLIIRPSKKCLGYMVRMADWLDDCHGSLCFLLSQKLSKVPRYTAVMLLSFIISALHLPLPLVPFHSFYSRKHSFSSAIFLLLQGSCSDLSP